MDEERRHKEKLLQILRTRLHNLEEQEAALGLQAPPHIGIDIAQTRTTIARIESELNVSVPTAHQHTSAQIRQQALKAFFRKNWASATDLLTQVLTLSPDDEDVRDKLVKAQYQLHLQEKYEVIRDLRADDDWLAVLEALEDLDRQEPDYPDPDHLRCWAQERQHEENNYTEALAACEQGDWITAISILQKQLTTYPEDPKIQILWSLASAQQQIADATAKRNQYAQMKVILTHLKARRLETARELLVPFLTTLWEPSPRGIEFRGYIAAGPPIAQSFDRLEDYLPIYDLDPQTHFALRVKGDSMLKYHICDGDLVVLRKVDSWFEVRDGDIVAVLLPDPAVPITGDASQPLLDHATLKKISKRELTILRQGTEGHITVKLRGSWGTMHPLAFQVKGVLVRIQRDCT